MLNRKKIYVPLLEFLAKNAEVQKIFGENISWNFPQKLAFPCVFLHTIGAMQKHESDDENTLFYTDFIAFRVVESDDVTESEIAEKYRVIDAAIGEAVASSEKIAKIQASSEGVFFAPITGEADYTQYERSYKVQIFG